MQSKSGDYCALPGRSEEGDPRRSTGTRRAKPPRRRTCERLREPAPAPAPSCGGVNGDRAPAGPAAPPELRAHAESPASSPSPPPATPAKLPAAEEVAMSASSAALVSSSGRLSEKKRPPRAAEGAGARVPFGAGAGAGEGEGDGGSVRLPASGVGAGESSRRRAAGVPGADAAPRPAAAVAGDAGGPLACWLCRSTKRASLFLRLDTSISSLGKRGFARPASAIPAALAARGAPSCGRRSRGGVRRGRTSSCLPAKPRPELRGRLSDARRS